jgi:predicted dehydrogenase
MPPKDASPTSAQPSRRDFLKTSAAAVAGAALAGGLTIQRSAHAAGSDTLKVGLVGCGGRGTGAAGDALKADKNCILTAMADAFDERLQGSLRSLKTGMGDRIAVDAEHCFTGLDGYRKLIDSGVDVVILATPPHFRPLQLKACIDAGKHVFCEKPVAVDAPGVRSVMATTEEAKKKNLNLVSGLCWRYYPATQEVMKRVRDGAIGEILAIQETYNTGTLWHRGRKPDDTEMAYQVRNWYYFTWLSGDHNVEQHVHSLDKGSWAMGDKPPVRAWGLGGRQVRTDPKYGDIYDHHAVVYEYPGGTRMYSYCRQQAGCSGDVTDYFFGTKGVCNVLNDYRITGENPWRADRSLRQANMYVSEHEALFHAIRSGNTINNGHYMALSTMLAILGRMVDYTGQTITWEEAINSQQDLSPARYAWDADPPTLPDKDGRYKIAMPGVTKLI